MNFDTGTISAIFTGLVAVLTALGAFMSQAATRRGASRKELREARNYIEDADFWIHTLERALRRRGVPLPGGKPKRLVEDGDDGPDDKEGTKALPVGT